MNKQQLHVINGLITKKVIRKLFIYSNLGILFKVLTKELMIPLLDIIVPGEYNKKTNFMGVKLRITKIVITILLLIIYLALYLQTLKLF